MNGFFARVLPGLLLAALLGAVPAPASAAEPDPAAFNGFRVDGALVPVEAIQRGGPPKDGIPAIDAPRFVPAARASLAAGDRVLGVRLAGIARAYPVRILNWHEVVNDRFADTPIAITWCPLCGTGMAFESRVGDRETSFGVSGLLYNSDVLLYDRATDSLWSQVMAQAVTGPMKGARLAPVPLTHTTWADWRARNPDTVVLSTDTGFTRDYDRDPYAGYDRIQSLMFDVQHRDDRFPLKEWVLGVELGGKVKAYPFSVLARAVDASGGLVDEIGGRQVRIRFDREHRSAQAFDASSGRELHSVTAFWFAWIAFHPRTEVLRAP